MIAHKFRYPTLSAPWILIILCLLSAESLHALGKVKNEEQIRLDESHISIRYEEETAYISHTFPYAKGDVIFSTNVILGRKRNNGEMSRLTFQYQPVVNLSTTDFDKRQNHTVTWSLPQKEFEFYRNKKLNFFIRNLEPIKLSSEQIKAIQEWKSYSVSPE